MEELNRQPRFLGLDGDYVAKREQRGWPALGRKDSDLSMLQTQKLLYRTIDTVTFRRSNSVRYIFVREIHELRDNNEAKHPVATIRESARRGILRNK